MNRVVFVVADQTELFDLAGPAQAFHEAALAGVPCTVTFVGPTPLVASEPRLTLANLAPLPGDLGAGDLVIVPGTRIYRARSGTARAPLRAISPFLRASHERGALIASICVGAFALGDAGLLDGRPCTTHWKYVTQLAERYPRAEVFANRLYVIDNRIASSAGIASGLDLSLALIDRLYGQRVAAAVAREMVVSVRRSGEGEQLGAAFAHRDHLAADIHLVQDWIVEHPGESYALAELAARIGLGERTLTRQFKAATGVTVHAYATNLRMEQARTLMLDPELSVEHIAERCGFSDGRQLRRLWNERFGESPSRYRAMHQ